MAVIGGMYISSSFDIINIDGQNYNKGLRSAVAKIVRQAAKLWLLEINTRIPWKTGFLLGAFGNLEEALGVKVENKTGPISGGLKQNIRLRRSKSDTERLQEVLRLERRVNALNRRIEGRKTLLQVTEGHVERKGSKKLRTKGEGTETSDEQRYRLTQEEGLRLKSRKTKAPIPKGEEAREMAERYVQAKQRQHYESQLRGYERAKMVLQAQINKKRNELVRRKSKPSSTRTRGKLRGVTDAKRKTIENLEKLRQIVASKLRGTTNNPYVPNSGSGKNKYVTKRVKVYKTVTEHVTKTREVDNPAFKSLTQTQRLKLLREKKPLPPRTITETYTESIQKKQFLRYQKKRVAINPFSHVLEDRKPNKKEIKSGAVVGAFRSYYYPQRGSKSKVLKTPRSGLRYATPVNEVFTQSDGQQIKPQIGYDDFKGKTYVDKGVTFTPQKSLDIAKVYVNSGAKSYITFTYRVDIKYWAIMDLYSGRKGAPWRALANANKKALDYIATNIGNNLPPLFQYAVKTKSTVVPIKKNIQGTS
jgi:hypothetical protein